MLGLSAEAWGALGTIAGTIAFVFSGVVGWAGNTARRAHDLEANQRQKDIDRMDASLKASWVHVDDLRINAVRRADQDRLREEFRADVRALGDRLEAAIGALRDDIHRERPGAA